MDGPGHEEGDPHHAVRRSSSSLHSSNNSGGSQHSYTDFLRNPPHGAHVMVHSPPTSAAAAAPWAAPGQQGVAVGFARHLNNNHNTVGVHAPQQLIRNHHDVRVQQQTAHLNHHVPLNNHYRPPTSPEQIEQLLATMTLAASDSNLETSLAFEKMFGSDSGADWTKGLHFNHHDGHHLGIDGDDGGAGLGSSHLATLFAPQRESEGSATSPSYHAYHYAGLLEESECAQMLELIIDDLAKVCVDVD